MLVIVPTREIGGSGVTTPCGVALAVGEHKEAVVYACSSHPSNAVCLGLCGAGGVPQPHPCVLRFSQWCLIHEELLAVLLVRSEVRMTYVAIMVTSLSLFQQQVT